jgi:hypothetical protein
VAAAPRICLLLEELLTMTTVIAEDKPAGTTRIHCPACHKRDIPAQIIEHIEKVTEYLVVHLSTHTTWWVVCSECKVRLFSKVSGAELERRTPDELVGVVVTRVGFVQQFLAVAAVVLAIAPGLGTALGLIAYVANRKSPGWPRIASKVALGLSVLIPAFFFVVIVISAMVAGKR